MVEILHLRAPGRVWRSLGRIRSCEATTSPIALWIRSRLTGSWSKRSLVREEELDTRFRMCIRRGLLSDRVPR